MALLAHHAAAARSAIPLRVPGSPPGVERGSLAAREGLSRGPAAPGPSPQEAGVDR